MIGAHAATLMAVARQPGGGNTDCAHSLLLGSLSITSSSRLPRYYLCPSHTPLTLIALKNNIRPSYNQKVKTKLKYSSCSRKTKTRTTRNDKTTLTPMLSRRSSSGRPACLRSAPCAPAIEASRRVSRRAHPFLLTAPPHSHPGRYGYEAHCNHATSFEAGAARRLECVCN